MCIRCLKTEMRQNTFSKLLSDRPGRGFEDSVDGLRAQVIDLREFARLPIPAVLRALAADLFIPAVRPLVRSGLFLWASYFSMGFLNQIEPSRRPLVRGFLVALLHLFNPVEYRF